RIGEEHRASAGRVPGVLGVAPVTAHVTPLQADEVRGRSRGGAFALDRQEPFADADGGGLGSGGRPPRDVGDGAQGDVNSPGRNSATVSTSRVNTFTCSALRCAVE